MSKSRTSAGKISPDAKAATNLTDKKLIDQRIIDLGKGDAAWRGPTLARMRKLILEAEPAILEEVKWRKPSNAMSGVPVWSSPNGGIICTGETYAKVVKLTFAHGAKIEDPSGLFNSSLEGNTRRAIDIREGETVDAAAFKKLVKAVIALNGESKSKTSKPAAVAKKTSVAKKAPVVKKTTPAKGNASGVKLLSGGNPQIAKADGDAPVQAYIAAMSGGGPGWKRDIGERIDAIITRSVPNVRKAVKWNSPFYGASQAQGGVGFFLGMHVMAKYVKIAFFRGASLKPMPPGESKQKNVRYLDLYEGDFNEKMQTQMANWIKQAAQLPGWELGKPG